MKQMQAQGDNKIIPTVIANTVRGMTDNRTYTFNGKEIVGYISIGPNTTAGLIAEIVVNPLLMGAARLRNFTQNFQQYRFKKLRATVRGNLPTTVGGDLYIAYTRNPDHSIVDNPVAPQNVFSIEGSIITNLWSATEFDCKCSTNQWYNVDDDSEEIMVTSHGKLFIATLGGFNITNQFEMPLFLEYVVECKGQQVQGDANQDALVFPATYYGVGASSDGNGSTQLFPQDGETISFPWNRGMVALQPYFCTPDLTLVLDPDNTTVTAEVIVWDGNTQGWFRFYESYEAFTLNEPFFIKAGISGRKLIGRFIIQPFLDSARSTITETRFRFSDGRRIVAKRSVNSNAAMQVSHRCQSCPSTHLINL